MAHANESPRQKMIGMMYLVLTAMLALQVSSALIDKFMLLNNSIESANGAANSLNQVSVQKIKEAVAKSSNALLYADVTNKAEETRKISSEMVGEIEALKQRIITEAGGGFDEQGNIKNLKEEELVAIMMVGANKNGEAYKLKDKLNMFAQKLSTFGAGQFAPLAFDGKDDPISSRSSEQRGKDFAELNFAQTPIPAALAVLSQKQAEIRRHEGQVLDYLASKVGAKEVKFDNIFAMVSAKSGTVVAGTPYEAEMFIAASSSGIIPRMSINGSGLMVKDGKGQIKFTAQGGAYDASGLAKKSFTGTISYQKPDGTNETKQITQEYFVAKPTYNILTGSLPGLYLGCANKLSIVSPGLGALWQPSFTADGADVVRGAKTGDITVVPSTAQVGLNINNGGNLLGTEKFKVQRVPRPELKLYINGGEADIKRGSPATSARSMEIRCIADEGFRISNPDDARFRATEVEVSLARGSRRMGSTSGSGAINISSLAAQAQPGDRYVIEVKKVQRMNFRNEVKDTGVSSQLMQLNLY